MNVSAKDTVFSAAAENDLRSAANEEIRFAIGECFLGFVLVAESERGIYAVLLGDGPGRLARDLQDRFAQANIVSSDSELEELVSKVISFIEAPVAEFDLPLDVRGTAFQQRVWQALREIPAGETVATAISQTVSAHRPGRKRSARPAPQILWRWRFPVIVW